MEKHCVSLELAKQLKEAGWKKETEFWWVINANGWRLASSRLDFVLENIPTPLSDEILEELPILDIVRKVEDSYTIIHIDTDYITNDKSLPNALAKMWLYLNSEARR